MQEERSKHAREQLAGIESKLHEAEAKEAKLVTSMGETTQKFEEVKADLRETETALNDAETKCEELQKTIDEMNKSHPQAMAEASSAAAGLSGCP